MGLVPAHVLPLPAVILTGLAAVALAILLWWVRRPGAALLLVLAFAGGLRYLACTALLPGHHIRRAREFGEIVRVRGTVHDEPVVGADRARFVLQLQELHCGSRGRAVCGRVLVTFRGLGLAADCGDTMVLQGRLRRPPEQRNPGGFDYRGYLQQQDIHATLSIRRRVRVIESVAQPGPWLHEWLVRPVRASVRASIERHLTGPSAALVLGMLLGDRHRIPAAVQDSFRNTGLAHALVISGLHVGLLAFFLYLLFTLMRCSDRLASAVTIAVLGAYALVTGMQPTVVRAVVMASVMLGGRALARNGDVYNSLGLAALVILGVWPQSLFGLSFQLSFAATLAIVGLHQPLLSLLARGRPGQCRVLRQYVLAPLCVSLAAQLGTGPLIACHFQQFAPLAPLANLIVVPLLGGAVGLGLLTALCGVVCPYAMLPLSACNSLVLGVMMRLVQLLAAVPCASLPVPRPGTGFVLWCALMTVLLARGVSHRPACRAAVFVLLLGGNALVWEHVLGGCGVEIACLDVGQGDAVFLRFANGRTLLVDGGDRTPGFDYGERVVLPFLRDRGVERLDVVVGTHPHSDHIGGLISVLEQVPVGLYLDNGQHSDSWAATRLRQLITARGISYHAVTAGDSLAGLGEAGILVLHPRPAFVSAQSRAPANVNNGSVVLRVTWGGTALLLTGDVEEEADAWLLAWGERLKAQILKVAHHGSRTSSTPRFLAAVDPGLALVSVGAANRFGHPAAEVMERLARSGIRLLRTDECGAILLRPDAGGVEIRTMAPHSTAWEAPSVPAWMQALIPPSRSQAVRWRVAASG